MTDFILTLYLFVYFYMHYYYYYHYYNRTIIRHEEGNNVDECSICLQNNNKNESITTYECNHNFHLNCLNEWVKNNPNCPNCRKQLNVISIPAC